VTGKHSTAIAATALAAVLAMTTATMAAGDRVSRNMDGDFFNCIAKHVGLCERRFDECRRAGNTPTACQFQVKIPCMRRIEQHCKARNPH